MLRLDNGESGQLTTPLTTETLSYIGAPNEGTNKPNFSSNNFVTNGVDDLTDAVGKLDSGLAKASVPVGSIIPHYDFGGTISIDTNYWAYCDGSTISNISSPINGQVTPDMSGRYLVGFGTDGVAGSMTSAAPGDWTTVPVGNISHKIDLHHHHTVDSHTHPMGNHTHTIGNHHHTVNHGHDVDDHRHSHVHNHPGPYHRHDSGANGGSDGYYATLYSAGSSIDVEKHGLVSWSRDYQIDTGTGIDKPVAARSWGIRVRGLSGYAGANSTGAASVIHTSLKDQLKTSVDTPSTSLDGATTTSAPDPGDTSPSSPGTSNSLSTTQSIQPRSVRVRYIMRIL